MQAASHNAAARWWIVVFGVGVIVVERSGGAKWLFSASPVAGQIAEAVTFGSTLLVGSGHAEGTTSVPLRRVHVDRAAGRFFGGTLLGP